MLVRGDAALPALLHAYNNADDILRTAARASQDKPIVASDLTLGSWRGHWVARELAAQLGIDLPFEQRPVPSFTEDRSSRPAQAVAELIDFEAAGDGSILTAHASARAIAERAGDLSVGLILVLGPQAGQPWMVEDLWLLHFLARALGGTQICLVVSFPAGSPVPPFLISWPKATAEPGGRPLEIVLRAADPTKPGMVGAGAAGELFPCIETLRGWAVLLPEARGLSDARKKVEIASSTKSLWLDAYHEMSCPIAERKIDVLSAGAVSLYSEGGYRQACRLLESAQEAARGSLEWTGLETQAQAMRIASMDFAAAAQRPDPDPLLPEPLLRELCTSKAWGLVMSGRPEEAERLFDRACAIPPTSGCDPMYLYLLNIAALNKLRVGKVQQAFDLEHRIESTLATLDPPDWHLSYINAINLARLFRHVRDYAAAQAYFEKAFSISEGSRSESDQVYLNICEARLEKATGNVTAALLSTLRAAMHWLAMAVPEALAPRVARALDAEPGDDLVIAVSQKICGELDGLLKEIGSPFANVCGEAVQSSPAWRTTNPKGEPAGGLAAGGPGWGVLLHFGQTNDSKPSLEQSRLAWMTARTLSLLSPRCEILSAACVVIDDGFGTEMPVTEAGLLQLAVRHSCRSLCYLGRRQELDDRTIHDLLRCSRLSLGPGVSGIAHDARRTAIAFRRSRRTVELTDDDAILVDHARNGRRIADLEMALHSSPEWILGAVCRLERSGVLATQLESLYEAS